MITKGINFPPAMKRVMSKLPLMIDCQEFETFIIAYFDDELTPRQRLIFNMHLRVCRECREYLRAYQASMTLARASAASAETELPELPEDLIVAVVDALSDGDGPDRDS
ncbi:zf-HC2 domain-containing protein [Parasphingopyxis sp. CP4]|uniref:anti-sigma factor family protein n=1 Tax=Parasphingopyxis sp. CP4 TaxID=2724527 RepID=UPI0015A48A39|nr:zf-HC2 domain-containing protein [Parasphingopyxis sp. CP4]QLC20769.1 zf-HC2 domain-containing protein [Parasphingopyxis sp. CP4]